jgi:hypothetical protein
MASIMKLVQDPKGYAAKKFKSTIKTVKSQPVSLAAGALGILAEMAENRHLRNRDRHGRAGLSTTSNLLQGLSKGAQLWSNASAARKQGENRREIASIIGDSGLSDDEKYTKILQLGDTKTASQISQRGQFKEALGLKKEGFEEKKKQNAITNNHFDRSFGQAERFHTDNVNLGFFHEDKKDQRANTANNSKLESNIIKAFGNIIAQGKGSKEDLVNLINNPGQIEGLQIQDGFVNRKTGSKRVNITPPTTLTPGQVDAFKRWKKEHGVG